MESVRRSGSGKMNNNNNKKKKGAIVVLLEDVSSDDLVMSRTKSLTDEDLDELKGCLDLGFGFNYDEIPELCNTLPALELCYSMSSSSDNNNNNNNNNSCEDHHHHHVKATNWKISSPGDDPEDVKARLKYWAQAVACTLKLCS